MPTIREYGQTVKQDTALPVRRATGEDFGAGVAQGMAQVGQSLSELGTVMERAKQAEGLSKLERLKSQHNVKLAETKFQLENDPDYIDNSDKFDETAQQLRSEAEETLGDAGLYDQYNTDMGLTYEKTSIGVRKDIVKRVSQAGKASLDESLKTYVNLAATADNEGEQEQFALQGNDAIDNMFNAGVLNPAEVGKYKSDFVKSTRTAIVGNMIDSDPLTTSVMATEREGIFAGMPEKERQGYQDKAITEYRDQLRFEQGQEDRNRQEIERSDKEAEEAVSKVLDEKYTDGSLQLADVQGSKDKLSAASYRFQLDRAVTGRKASTDAHVYSDLLLRAMRGENIKTDVTTAYHAYSLERGAFDHILSVYNTKSGFGSSGVPDKFKKAEEYVEKATKPNDLNPSAGSARRQADALKMMWTYMQENPSATQQEALEEATTVVDRFSIINQGEFQINTPTPKLMVGSRNSIDVTATRKATVDAFGEGRLTKREYIFELNNLDSWDQFNDERALNKEGAK